MVRYVKSGADYDETTPILNPNGSKIKDPTCCPGFSSSLDRCAKKFYEVIPSRYVFAFISCIGFFNVSAMRVNLNVAMVAMVGEGGETDSNFEDIACNELLIPPNDNYSLHTNVTKMMHGEFNWDSTTQNNILGAFFYGYVITQIPGGIIAEKYGAKWLFGVGILITAVLNLLTPMAARYSYPALITVRVIEGLGEGATYPAMNSLIGRWVPKNERSRISTFIYNGSPIGNVISLAVSGYLSSSYKYGGWPMTFYLFGGLGCLWFVFWIFLIYESPYEHPRISKSELQHIQAGLEHIPNANPSDIPWRSILTSIPLWALVFTHFGYSWGFYIVITELPTYLSNILHFDLQQNGLLSAAPSLCKVVFSSVASGIADKMRSTERFKITTIRKIMNSISFFIPCILTGCIVFAGCNSIIIVSLFILSEAFSGFSSSGLHVTHVDMSPEFAGTLMGITHSVSSMAGFLAPAYVGFIVKSGQTIRNWGIVFLTSSAIYLITGLIYICFGSAELQPWGLSKPPATSSTHEKVLDDEKNVHK